MRHSSRSAVPAGALLSEAERVQLQQGIAQLRLGLSADQERRLFEYARLIQKWNAVYNLTAIRNPSEIITHHLLDSLAVIPAAAQAVRGVQAPHMLDVGAGAGLPGLVFAIAQPGWNITLIDTVQKKAAFMQQAIGSLGLRNAQAVHGRVEQHQAVQPYHLICSRAFSTMGQMIDLSAHALHPEGAFAALKGRLEVDNEVPEGWRLEALHPIEVPFLGEDRHLFVIRR
ncbi:16S rRNA (guanine(527)-N(7))-methyltransferase RsmG [Limnobacter sp.]|uniref:16S rRNA (guanine(527)-N(7))-methyltransferase RsmG n=1 Tax=Limnobacter sp. TaxID=2003368 RepID=UPI0035181CD4